MIDKDIKIIELKKNEHLVLDVNSGSIHIFDDISKNSLIKYLNGQQEMDLTEKEALSEIKELIAEGSLLSKDNGELPKNVNHNLKSICLNVAHICNLACPYCFASGGNYKGTNALMTLEVGKKAIDFLLKNSQERPILEVDFFGGEPLLNFKLIKKLVSYGNEESRKKGKVIKWSMTTNGVLLDEERTDFLIANNIGTVLSIDGRKDIHNYNRHFKNGKGSFDIVMNNYLKFKEYTEDYVVRGTYTSRNLDFYKDVEFLKNSGFSHISIEPVIGEKITLVDLDTIKNSYKKLTELYLKWLKDEKPLDFFHFNINLKGGPCIYKRITACGAGFEYLAVTPTGDLYPCHQLIENQKYLMGNIMDNTFNNEIAKEFLHTNIYTKDKCKNCWARFYCSGGCHSNNLKYGKGLNEPDDLSCELQKIRLEAAILVQGKILLENLENNNFKSSDIITKEKINNLLK